ncbi:MAG: hypothetical protein JXX29_09005 [Deltaproteobacteria bacterium]|nr:hypothetical protein [Deltaproteobacteria bacterium]MBN2671800.1 hypothetical protein [Deltaproteobacteria bacterium]
MKSTQSLILIIGGLILLGCGSAAPETNTAADGESEPLPKVRLTAEDYFRAELVEGEFTDEVDEQRYKAVGETLTEVSPRQRVVYFVGKLRRVPTQAKIQVHWCHDKVKEPMVVTDVYGSDTFSFVSSFTPPGRKFIPGEYTVNVLVNDRVVGSRTFKIKGVDPFSEGIKVNNLKIAKKIHKRSMAAIKPDKQFAAANKLFASFKVKNCVEPTELVVKWYRSGSLFSESNISVDGNGQFSANVESPSGLPQGVYSVEVEHFGDILAEAKFAVGNASMGPTIDTIALGTSLGKGSMPKQETTKFKKGTSAIFLGLRFLDLEPNSEILIEWVMMDATSESIYHTVATPIPSGGSGTMSADWSPGEIYSGDYKAVVYINGELSKEKEFTVQ